MPITNPGKSCADIYQINKTTGEVSGDYRIETHIGESQVYCDIEWDTKEGS